MNAIIPSSPTPQLDLSAIDRAALQPSTKAKYRRELERLALAGVDPRDFNALQVYADGLKSSRKQFLKSAIRLTVQGLEQTVKANARPESIAQTQAALYRLDAMKSAVTVEQHKGTRAHVWLSAGQVRAITAQCPDTLEGMRDKTVLYLLLGAGLRRQELSELTFDALKTVPMKSGKMRSVIEVKHGKGDKSRVIPVSQKLGDHLRAWQQLINAGPSDRVVRAITRGGKLTGSMSAVSLFELTRKYGRLIDVPDLACHDCRRSYAQLGYQSGIAVTQIKELLGHASVATTQKYLDLSLDVEQTASDFIPLS